jgi:hypothetical protein
MSSRAAAWLYLKRRLPQKMLARDDEHANNRPADAGE